MNEVISLSAHYLVPPLSAHCVHWRSLRNKGSLSYADLPDVDTFYYTIYKKYRHARLLVSPQPFQHGNQSSHEAVHSERLLLPVPEPGPRRSAQKTLCPATAWTSPASCLDGHTMSCCCFCKPPCVPCIAKGSCFCQHLFSQYTFTVPVAGCLLPCMYLRWWPTACPATPDQLQSDQTSKLLCDLMIPSPMVPDPLPIFPSLGILCQLYRYHKEFPYILQLLLYHS